MANRPVAPLSLRAGLRVNTEQVAIAERSLAADLPTWRTDTLEGLFHPRAIISPCELPDSAYHAYDTLWCGLDMREATDLLRHLAAPVLAGRSVFTYTAPCPKCGHPDAEVTDYDCGRYTRARHPAPAPPEGAEQFFGKGYRPSHVVCYSGPLPAPTTYEGDAE